MIVDPGSIDRLFLTYDRLDTPGCVLGVIHEGQIVYQKGYGMADLERGIPLTPDSVFDIASTGKQFAAFIVLALAQQGKLDLNASLRRYLPELHPSCDPVSITHLLHHTSGLRDYCSLMELTDMPLQNYYPEGVIFDLIARQRSLCFHPGDEFLYSNTGYFLFNRIVQRASGRSLLELIREWIFEPLGMEHSTFNDDFSRIIPKRALAYSTTDDEGFQTNVSFLGGFGDGPIMTTVGDLNLWDQNFYHNRLCDSEQKMIEQLQTRGRLNDGEFISYACGLQIGDYRGLKWVRHSGSWAGYCSQFMRFPELHFSVIVLANLATVDATTLALSVADQCLVRDFHEPAVRAPQFIERALPSASQEQLSGYYRCERTGCLLALDFKAEALMLTLDGDLLELAATSPTRFRPKKDGYGELSLEIEEGTAASQPVVKVHWEGEKPEHYDRLSLVPKVSARKLYEYVGEYYSEELKMHCNLVIKDKTLVLRHGYAQSTQLNYVAPDLFWGDQLDLQFERNPQDEVVKFWLGASRLRGIAFIKLNSAR